MKKDTREYFSTVLVSLGFVILFLLSSCKKDNPVIPPEPSPVDHRKITLANEGTSCSEIWLKLTADSINLPISVILNMNSTMEDITLSNRRDTVLYFDSLPLNSSYRFSAALSQDTLIKSNELQVNTLSPTSHNFTYQTFELGDPLSGYSSILYGASIIDGNNIWVVGEIYEVDSSGNDIQYNAAHWNGTDWELKQILYYTICGQSHKTPYPVGSIVQVENQLWAAMRGNEVVRISDTTQTEIMCLPLSMEIYSVWGNNSSNVYAAGNLGNIARYDGNSWQSIPSPTILTLIDIYSNGNGAIYAAGIDVSQDKGIVLKGNSSGFSVMINSEIITEDELFDKLYGELESVWVDENGIIYAGGDLLYRYKNNQWNYETSLPENYIGGNPGAFYRGSIASIRGNGSNDYIIAGGRNTLKHFNGIDWEQIGLPYSPSSPIAYGKVEQKGNTAVAVGWNGNKAFIILLKR